METASGASAPPTSRGRAPRTRLRLLTSIAVAVAVAALAALSAPSMANAAAGFLSSPGSVAGANDWNCKPSAQHPHPVVLVHGTTSNLSQAWAALSPMLANDGYCVYALNYGTTWLSLGGRVNGLGNIPTSAAQLSAFVDRVLAATGASQVDIVGHSQGGMMPNYYLKFLGGAAKVHMLVGLAPSNHGTTLSGLTRIAGAWSSLLGVDILGGVNAAFYAANAPAFAQQELGSQFETNLFAGGDTVPGPSYVVIETSHDEVVTPFGNAFLIGPNAQNILLQDQCPKDRVGHIGMTRDSPALQDVLNAVGADSPSFSPSCSGYGAGI